MKVIDVYGLVFFYDKLNIVELFFGKINEGFDILVLNCGINVLNIDELFNILDIEVKLLEFGNLKFGVLVEIDVKLNVNVLDFNIIKGRL